MFWTLLTVFIAGFAGAGIGMMLRHLTRNRLPKGIIPICAGLTMIAATIGQEYGWYENVLDTLPADTVVIFERQQQAWYQPWTFVQPWVRGFIGYSPSDTVETAAGSGILVVQTQLHERWNPAIVKPVLVDCGESRRADILQDTDFDDAGQPMNAGWLAVGNDDPIIAAVCQGQTAAS
jgi:hypothetical protein